MNNTLRRLAAIVAAALPLAAAAADWPAKPLRWIVPFAAGGPTDGVARTVAQHVSKTLGQPVLIENKPGAEGAIAAQTVATSSPDGYTFLVGTSGTMALPATSAATAGFRISDFAPVGAFGSFAYGLFVHPDVPAKSVKELVAHAKAQPGKLNYASANMSEHMATAQFLRATGTDLVRVPYKGAAQAVPDLLANRVQVYFTPLVAGLQQAKDGRLRLLATVQPGRSALAPEAPTLVEAGVSGVAVQTRQMLFAPAKTAPEIVEKLARAVEGAIADPAVKAQLEARALVVEGASPAKLAALLERDNRDWAAFAREHGTGQ